MHIEIICIGTELLLDFVNTNTALISERLATVGLKTTRVITVGDDFSELKNVFAESLNRSDIVVTCGGLGPTFDDITVEVVSKTICKRLVLNKELLKKIADYFEKKNIKMPKSTEKQAYILESAEIIPNNLGTASGEIVELNNKTVILLPGPPRELKPMLDETVVPYLKKRFEKNILKVKTLHTTGLSESYIDDKIKKIVEIEKRLEGSEVKFIILSKHTGVDIKIMLSGTDELLIDKTIKNLKQEFYDILKENIYGEDNQLLESVVGELLLKKRKTLAVAESCTGGLITHRLTNVAGSSLYFKEGVVAYSDNSKKRIFGVKEETLNKYGAVSKEIAKEMAESIKKIATTNFGLSTTGIAGPKPSSTGKPVGLVYIGLTSDKETIVKQFNFSGSRTEIKDKIATAALDILRKSLI
ncbi:MAG: competence/damage-inducible protein A [Elusimicrobiota bacterium]